MIVVPHNKIYAGIINLVINNESLLRPISNAILQLITHPEKVLRRRQRPAVEDRTALSKVLRKLNMNLVKILKPLFLILLFFLLV